MTLGRRQVFGLGALGLGAVALDGCNVLPWARSPDGIDVEAMLRDLDKVVAQLGTIDPDAKSFGIKPGARYDAGRATSTRLLTSLCFMGTYRHVPEAMWTEPRVEPRLAKTLPEIYDTIRAARGVLAELGDADYARIDKRLQREPELTMRIMERIDEYAGQIGVPIEQRTYLRTSTAQLSGRFRYEGTKEVVSKLAAKYDRNLKARKAEVGFPADEAPGGAPVQVPPPLPRRQFVTRAAPAKVREAACAIDPRVTVDGVERRVIIDSEEQRCPVRLAEGEPPPVRGALHIEPAVGGENVVTIELDTPGLSAELDEIARHLQGVLAPAPPPVAKAPTWKPLGAVGETCRTRADCQEMLDCTSGTCAPSAPQRGSEKLLHTTGQVAKWGAILLIPPICAVGVLVLLTALFMVIVAGIMHAGGN